MLYLRKGCLFWFEVISYHYVSRTLINLDQKDVGLNGISLSVLHMPSLIKTLLRLIQLLFGWEGVDREEGYLSESLKFDTRPLKLYGSVIFCVAKRCYDGMDSSLISTVASLCLECQERCIFWRRSLQQRTRETSQLCSVVMS